MSEVKHTPGPWRADIGSVYGDQDQDGWTAVALTPCPSSPPKSARRRQWEADARLIAAAPDLLEAAKAAQIVLAMLTEPAAIKSTTVMHAWTQAMAAEGKVRAAIAKADGE